MAARKGTPIEVGIVALASRTVRAVVGGAIKGANDAWFGPSEPMAVDAPANVRGRAFDYGVASNLNIKPRTEPHESAISFWQLRALADPTQGGLDLLREVIDKRKDQMEAQEWKIRARDGTDGGPRARDIEQAMLEPDGYFTFSQWQRMIVEDLLVIDAPCVYLCPSTLGHLVPQVMDGALIKPLLRPDGRRPLAPEPAYQQSLKGVPAVNYTTDELIYLPRNVRSYRIYGMSPVEQLVTIVNIAIRRQLSQLEYYTAGSVPDVLLSTPETWTSEMVREFQGYWDSLLSGNTEERRRARFVPGGVKPYELKPGALKDEYDEWIARVVCFCFSISPQAFSKQMNRATAETAKQSAAEEGLEPMKKWWKDFIDKILSKAFGAPDLEMVYADEEISDPATKATVMATALGAGGGKPWLTVDEVRAKYGEQPLTDDQREELMPPPPPQLDPNNPDGGGSGDGSTDGNGTTAPEQPAKVAKARRSLRPRSLAGL